MAAKNHASDMTCNAVQNPRPRPSSSRMTLETEVANEKQRLIAATPIFRKAALSSLVVRISADWHFKERGWLADAGIERSPSKGWLYIEII